MTDPTEQPGSPHPEQPPPAAAGAIQPPPSGGTSLPRLSVRNPVVANLIMLTILVGGVICALTLVREMFPESRPEQVLISTIYPGATPAEVEKGISIKIEEKIKGLEDVDEIRTTIGEGTSVVVVSLRSSVDDVDQAVDDVQAEIDTIPREDLPEDAEETRVVALEPRLPVISLSLYGDIDEPTLKQWGKRLRDDLLAIPGITDVVLSGTRPDEISVEVQPQRLVEYGLSFAEVADAVRRSNLDLPGGLLRTTGGNVAVRTLGEKDRAERIEEIIVRSDPQGRVIRLRDVASVTDGYEEVDLISRFNAVPAVSVTVYKTGDQDAIEIAAKVKAFTAGKTGQPFEQSWLQELGLHGRAAASVYAAAAQQPYTDLPGGMATHNELARFIEGRLDLLKRNGAWGLGLVFLTLLLFMNWRVAFWVMMGLVLAILGTLIVMKFIGLTLNLVTMFGLIIVLGMLVDDAIVVAEHVYTKLENGVAPDLAAIEGAEAVTWPIVGAVTTTIVAFLPLMFIEGRIGDFFGVLPIIVITALSISLFEALAVLPAHLAHMRRPRFELNPAGTPGRRGSAPTAKAPWIGRFRTAQRRILHDWLLRQYERVLRLAVEYRYVTLGVVAAAMLVALASVVGGWVPFQFIQKADSETLMANLEMPVGTPVARTDEATRIIERATQGIPEIVSTYTVVGMQFDTNGGDTGLRSHLSQLLIELAPVEDREARGQRNSEEVLLDLRRRTADIPGANSLRYEAIHGGPGGAALQIELAGERVEDLVTVTQRMKRRLARFEGVFDISDDFEAGRREVQIELLDSARALGLTTQDLAGQVRAAFYGLEARKLNRDREDVRIMVRFPPDTRRQVYDLESMWVSTPAGRLVPFTEVARIREGRSFAAIHRLDQKRTVTLTADVDESAANAQVIGSRIAAEFPTLRGEFPVTMQFGGQRREFAKSFGSLRMDFGVALLLIYAILAALFRSYTQPLIVMTAIPCGVVGAVVGHWVMGYPLTILSLIGLVALTGIVVNDSLILLDFINREVAAGVPVFEAVIDGGKARLRAIILTSVTTIAGLAPLMAERSFQARFLIPMAISISFGLAFATVLTLVIVPSLYLVVHDLRGLLRRIRGWVVPSPQPGRVQL